MKITWQLAPPAKTTFTFLSSSKRNTAFLESISVVPIIRSQRKLGKPVMKIPYQCPSANPQISIIETIKSPIPPVLLTSKAVFALPTVGSMYPLLFLSASPDGLYRNLIPLMCRSPRLSISSGVHHHPVSRSFTLSPNGTGYKVFVNRSLSSQNM